MVSLKKFKDFLRRGFSLMTVFCVLSSQALPVIAANEGETEYADTENTEDGSNGDANTVRLNAAGGYFDVGSGMRTDSIDISSPDPITLNSFVYNDTGKVIDVSGSSGDVRRDHYYFKGWYENGKVALTTGLVGNRTLTAGWDPENYTFEFSNGDTYTWKLGSSFKFPKVKGVTGWIDERTDYYYDAGSVTDGMEDVDGDGVKEYLFTEYSSFRAVDEPQDKQKVDFKACGGSGSMKSQTYDYGSESCLPSCTFSRNGYVFAGWAIYDSDREYDVTEVVYYDNAISYNAFMDYDRDGSLTLAAVWVKDEKSSYDVYINFNYPSALSGRERSYSDGDSYTLYSDQWTYLDLKGIYAKGYTLAGFSDSPSGRAKVSRELIVISDSKGTYISDDNGSFKWNGKTIYAIWMPETVTVKFIGNGADSGSMNDQTVTMGEKASLKANGFKKSGSSFQGWDTDSSGKTVRLSDKQKLGSTDAGEDGLFGDPVSALLNDGNSDTIYLYAVWSGNSYTIKYDANTSSLGNNISVSGSMKDQTVGASEMVKIAECGFSIPNYVFDGWNTKVDSTGAGYAPGAQVRGLSSGNGSTVKLYARWKPVNATASTVKISTTWDDSNNRDGLRPMQVTYTVTGTANGKNVSTEYITVNTQSGTAELKNKPVTWAENGKAYTIKYTVSVPQLTGYVSSVASSGDGFTQTVNFVHSSYSKNIKVTVNFADNNDQARKRPAKVNIVLTGSDGTAYQGEAFVNNASASYIFTGLPVNTSGRGVSYTPSVKLDAAYTTGIAQSGDDFEITATCSKASADIASGRGNKVEDITAQPEVQNIQPAAADKRDVVVRTLWHDNGSGVVRPERIELVLIGSNGAAYAKTLTPASDYAAQFDQIAAKDENGNNITYSLSAGVLADYALKVNELNDGNFLLEITYYGGSGVEKEEPEAADTILDGITVYSAEDGNYTTDKKAAVLNSSKTMRKENKNTGARGALITAVSVTAGAAATALVLYIFGRRRK